MRREEVSCVRFLKGCQALTSLCNVRGSGSPLLPLPFRQTLAQPRPTASPPMEEDAGEGEGEGEVEIRDWAGMPSDALFAVFGRLDVADILTGAGRACRAWRRLADGDPALWRRLDMTHHGDILETEEAEAMARAAVDRAAGTLQSFCADTFVTDALLGYISGRAPSLKSLQLSLCDEVSNEALAEAVKGFPQLEELEITFCSLNSNVCESVGRACPQLKSFRLNERWTILQRGFAAFEGMDDDTGAVGIASSMPELRDLQLIGNNLTNAGLAAILDHCPRLESLDVRRCCNLQMDDALRSKCARIGNLRLPGDPISDFKYRAYLASSDDYPDGSDIEVDMYDDLLDVVTDDDEDAEFDDMADYIDGADSDADMYDDVFDA